MRSIKHIWLYLVIILSLAISSCRDSEKKIPFTLELQKGRKHLVVYGCRHSFDPKDPMFNDIERRFMDLMPELTLNEGGDWPVFPGKNETIRKSGEQGFIRFLSLKNGIDVRTFEPSPKKEFDYILSKYDSKEVLLMYFCRQTAQLQNLQEIDNFKSYMAGFLNKLKKDGFPMGNADHEFDSLIIACEQLFGEKFNWRTFNPENVWPNYNNTFLNEINRDVSKFRDEHIIKLIGIELEKNDNIFVLIGGNHLLEMQEEIRLIFEKIN